MGSLSEKKLSEVVRAIAKREGIKTFVETGTYKGVTSVWAAEHFSNVITLEIDPETIKTTRTELAHVDNIEFLEGCSRVVLPRILKDTKEEKLCFWLDAHKGGGYFGSGNDCPLIGEIEAINASAVAAYIFIDDARGFLKPPPPPFDWRYWPDISTVLSALNQGPEPRYIIVVDDVIVCVPKSSREALQKAFWDAYPTL
ncbi:hypothetical protein [Roseibium sediminicola]|uniref:Class I SAM-dependent methyltransferase n=1 Tax=Roseibium sediminicola TaxID=2933272 RepID=A0ABT0H3X1_9HYPH|nr:hypothetical protein [Roseibium sp. CAU 1639]MCK7616155.1 hypothetical protein [Roseibium sp. CAU 1639]